MTEKNDLYRRLKIAGLLSFIPFVLAGGVLAGYLVGELLVRRFGFTALALPICIGLGVIGSIINVVKIIKLALKTNREA